MNIIHTGDWHIKIPEKNETWYIERLLKFFDYVIHENPDELLITGDIFDKTPTALEIGLLIGFLYGVDCPIFIVAGNHDRAKRKTIRADYLKCILQFLDKKNLIWTTDKIKETPNYIMVPNICIRKGEKIPDGDGKKWLLSHIRHELSFSKEEYDLSSIKGYPLILLSDIHTTFRYNDYIYYSTSPYRTNKKTITELSEIDNGGFGYNILNSKEEMGEFEGENVVIRREDFAVDLTDNVYEVIENILIQDFKISQPSKYIDLLIRLVGDLNAT